MEKTVSGFARKGGAILFLILMFHYAHAQNNDIRLLRKINGNENSAYTDAMQATSNSAYIVSAGVPLAQLLTGYIKHDSVAIENGWQTCVSLGVDLLLTTGLKLAVNRDRPYKTYADIMHYQNESTSSFPSGHTSACFAVATSLSIEYPKWYVIAPSYAWASTVGYSRMYLGMHYPSDVAAGAIVGCGSAWISYKGTQWLQHHGKLKGGFFRWILRR